jgi:hypothetical protein
MAGCTRGVAVLVVRAWHEDAPETAFRARVTQVFDLPPDGPLEEALGTESVQLCASTDDLTQVLNRWLLRLNDC